MALQLKQNKLVIRKCGCGYVGGCGAGMKHAKTDSSRKLSEFFRQAAPRSSSPSSRPGSGNSSRDKGAESGKEAGPVMKTTKSVEIQTLLTTADLVELEGKASSSHLTASLQQVRGHLVR